MNIKRIRLKLNGYGCGISRNRITGFQGKVNIVNIEFSNSIYKHIKKSCSKSEISNICHTISVDGYNESVKFSALAANQSILNEYPDLLHNMEYDPLYTVKHHFLGDDMESTSNIGHIEGVPSEFINSFGNYIGLKYFLDGIKNKEDIYTYVDKNINPDDLTKVKDLFGQCRYLEYPDHKEYEFYDPDIGYIVIKNNNNTSNISTIICAIGRTKLRDLVLSLDTKINYCPTATWVTGIDQYNELIKKSFNIQTIYEYRHEYYPFMNGMHIDEYVNQYLKSSSSILLLIGPPGTSKTNFIRQMISSANESVLLTYSESIKDADALFSYFYDSPEKFLIIEDADTYIQKRSDGNTNMKQLLNITDGLTANPDKKVIFSTNLPSLNNVDPALLRPGRCFDKKQFSRLTGEYLHNAINRICTDGDCHGIFDNLKHKHEGYTIAELFAIKDGEYNEALVEESTRKVEFGFMSK